jgi:hypothetical protein
MVPMLLIQVECIKYKLVRAFLLISNQQLLANKSFLCYIKTVLRKDTTLRGHLCTR